VSDNDRESAAEFSTGATGATGATGCSTGAAEQLPTMPTSAGEQLPAIPASAGAMIFDSNGRLLILKPTYKSGWTIPGGVMEADGETPWQACRREVREECGLDVRTGRLACVDFRGPRPGRPGGMRFLFDCGRLDDDVLRALVLQPEEISEHQLLRLSAALPLLSGPVRRRVRAAAKAKTCRYLEDGRPVPGVGP
jgi:8-oxo-dGTP diphosphatase